MTNKPFLSRRGFLKVSSLATGGVLLEKSGFGGPAHAAGTDPKFLLLVYFGGGWDQLLALDPRDNTLAKYNFSNGGMTAPSTGIQPAYQPIADSDANAQSVLTATAGTGVQTSGNLTFGPAVPQSQSHGQHSQSFAPNFALSV